MRVFFFFSFSSDAVDATPLLFLSNDTQRSMENLRARAGRLFAGAEKSEERFGQEIKAVPASST